MKEIDVISLMTALKNDGQAKLSDHIKKQTYDVQLELKVVATIKVTAENEEQAKAIAIEGVKENPYYYAGTCDKLIEVKPL